MNICHFIQLLVQNLHWRNSISTTPDGQEWQRPMRQPNKNVIFEFMEYLELNKSKILKLKPELQRKFSVGTIGLFGSIVREDFLASRSDIDIIVDFTSPVGIEFIDLAEFLESRLNHKIDLVSRKGIKPQYFRQIESEIVYV